MEERTGGVRDAERGELLVGLDRVISLTAERAGARDRLDERHQRDSGPGGEQRPHQVELRHVGLGQSPRHRWHSGHPAAFERRERDESHGAREDDQRAGPARLGAP